MEEQEYLQAWEKRVRTPLAEYVILWKSAYSAEPTYPYSLHNILVDLWSEENAPSLQTVYATVKRLEKSEMIESHQEIVGSRAQKIIRATKKGIHILESMENSFQGLNTSLRNNEFQ